MNPVLAFQRNPESDGAPDGAQLSRGLGWFSLALGLTELAAPKTVARMIGVDPRGATSLLLRAVGVREIVAGLGVLMRPRRPLPLWGRVAGDAIDLALLGVAAATRRTSTPRLAGAIAAAASLTALDVIAGKRTQRAYDQANRPVLAAITIHKPPEEVYAFFRKLPQLPVFMNYLESVRELDARRSRWVAKLPVGTVSWDAEIVDDRPGQLISWRSIDPSLLDTRGRVTFTKAPGRNATELRVEMQLGFLGTEPTASLARFFTTHQIQGDLLRLKQVLETGEVLQSDVTLHRLPHPAQPPAARELPPVERPQVPLVQPSPAAAKGVTP